ncbi:MAG TPA: hypothetical protein PLO43_03770, partial [Chlamydiales bacterium]|nr:hypothetical protein [Chlamydiales bacterium]
SSFDTTYMTGHDLWRKDATIKKTVLSRDLAHILSQLTKIKPMQIGFDQVLQTSPSTLKFTQKPCLLKEISSVGPAIGGLLINLSQDAIETDAPLPQTPGNLLFFGAELPLPFPDIVSLPDQLFLLIVYCNVKPRYLACPNDPHSHQLKKQGYGTGDHLTSDTHPIIR